MRTLQTALRRFEGDFSGGSSMRQAGTSSETAKHLDVARSQVYKLINVHGLERGKK
jgi:hypothetical protein